MTASSRKSKDVDPFDRIIRSLNKHRVDYLMVGGWAVIYHGFNRTTQDMDLLIRRTKENARRAVVALEEVGLDCPELTPDVFLQDNGIALGEPPLRVDILSYLPGVDFDQAWSRRRKDFFGPYRVNYLSRKDLIANKPRGGASEGSRRRARAGRQGLSSLRARSGKSGLPSGD